MKMRPGPATRLNLPKRSTTARSHSRTTCMQLNRIAAAHNANHRPCGLRQQVRRRAERERYRQRNDPAQKRGAETAGGRFLERGVDLGDLAFFLRLFFVGFALAHVGSVPAPFPCLAPFSPIRVAPSRCPPARVAHAAPLHARRESPQAARPRTAAPTARRCEPLPHVIPLRAHHAPRPASRHRPYTRFVGSLPAAFVEALLHAQQYVGKRDARLLGDAHQLVYHQVNWRLGQIELPAVPRRPRTSAFPCSNI